MGKIFYLMGKSSSGKDTLYKRILSDDRITLDTIIPYTTRPIRDGEVDGIEYHFVTESQLHEIEKSGKLIELRSYDTFHGVWNYFTVDDGQIDLVNKNYIVIGTIESYCEMRDYFGEQTVIPIMIDLDDGVRLQRALSREISQQVPKYEELCRRFLADAIDFSDEKMEQAGIKKIFHNDDLEHCLEEIISYME